MKFDNGTPKILTMSNDNGFRIDKKNIGYTFQGKPVDEKELILPMIKLLHCMNGYQS